MLLLGMVFMSSSQSSAQLPKDFKGGGKQDPISRCTHPIILRDQLNGPESIRAVLNMRCSQGFKIVENNYKGLKEIISIHHSVWLRRQILCHPLILRS